MTNAETKKPWIGQSVERLEDPPLVAGRGEFAGDINFPHQLHMRIVRSAHAHGRIVSIDAAAARALPGVFAVWTAADIADVPPIDFREGSIPALDPYRQPVLANGRVRYVGEPVAAVFADDPYVAEDAADLVTMEIEELPPVLDAQAAPCEFSPGHDSEAALIRQGYGDVDAVFRAARARGRARTRHRPPFRRAAGDARRHRPLRCLARHPRSCTAPPRCRTATRNCCRACSASPPSSHPRLRVPCRRRLRHPRRALSRGRAGLRRRDAARPAGEMDRGPARASDRRQSFAPAAAQDPRRGR